MKPKNSNVNFTPKQMEFLKNAISRIVNEKWEVKIITGLNFKPVISPTMDSGAGIYYSAKDWTIPYPLYEKLAYQLGWLKSNEDKDDTAFTDYLVFTPEAVCFFMFQYEPNFKRQ